jgi:regulator of protease activity HflC (stomatin/prohibitin superfamily)
VASLLEILTLGAIQFAVVRQGETRIIERRGKFVRVAEPGVAMLFALWGYGETIGRFTISALTRAEGRVTLKTSSAVEVIPTRMQVDDYPKESVITRDNATVHIDAVVYYRIGDPKKAVYEVNDYVSALQKLVQSALRDECGKYELDELLVSRDKINTQLRVLLDEATDPWGINVERVEIKDIDLGLFGKILAEQRAAETRRRTEITEAEGQKQSAILRAEGLREAAILEAEGDKRSRILRAEAEKEAEILHAEARATAIRALKLAEAEGYESMQRIFDGSPSSRDLLTILQLQKAGEVSEAMAKGKATTVYLPADIASVFGFAKELMSSSSD